MSQTINNAKPFESLLEPDLADCFTEYMTLQLKAAYILQARPALQELLQAMGCISPLQANSNFESAQIFNPALWKKEATSQAKE